MRVSHLLNIASSPYFMQETEWPGISPMVFTSFYEQLTASPEHTVQNFIRLQGHPTPMNASLHRTTSVGLRTGLDILLRWDLRSALFNINVPVCYLFGRLDAIVPQKLMNIMREQYPRFHYEMYKKSAHVPFLSHPEQFKTLLDEFLV